mmetsp:Transcript_94744/g.203533  ORF Transcript_94744/g.203533 Transcript_94744/m.203533 type:complete len:252 (-) Transcript_94744:73-828(-)
MESCILHGHVCTRNAHMIKATEAVVLVVVTDLGTNVANRNSWQGFMRRHVTDRDHEVVDAEVTATHEQASVDDGVIGSATQGSRPPLCAGCGGAVNLDFVALRHIGRRCLERPDITTMPELSLCIATNHLPSEGLGQPKRLLLCAEGRSDVRDKHQVLQVRAELVMHEATYHLRRHTQLPRQLKNAALLLHRPLVALRTAQVVDVGIIKDRVRFHDLLQLLITLGHLPTSVEQVRELAHREGGALPLRLKR